MARFFATLLVLHRLSQKWIALVTMVTVITAGGTSSSGSFISIRGVSPTQRLPLSAVSSWQTWTFDSTTRSLVRVEDASSDEGWVQCSSCDKLFLPADLPIPQVAPALGVLIANGVPRYIMPSAVITLATPERTWRNRGVNSLPRARAWIDLFGAFTPTPMDKLKLSAFGRSTNDVRFLEDQDGSTAWESLLVSGSKSAPLTSLRPLDEPLVLDVQSSFAALKQYLLEANLAEIREGYHFIDSLIPFSQPLPLPSRTLKMYLTDISAPRGLLEYEDSASLDDEPLGELSVEILRVNAGGSSKYLPQVYAGLYEPGNILVDYL